MRVTTALYAQAVVMTLVLMHPSALDTSALSNPLAGAARLFLQPGAFMLFLEGVQVSLCGQLTVQPGVGDKKYLHPLRRNPQHTEAQMSCNMCASQDLAVCPAVPR